MAKPAQKMTRADFYDKIFTGAGGEAACLAAGTHGDGARNPLAQPGVPRWSCRRARSAVAAARRATAATRRCGRLSGRGGDCELPKSAAAFGGTKTLCWAGALG